MPTQNISHSASREADLPETTVTRARLSRGASNNSIYGMVRDALVRLSITGETLVDVGCGEGKLWDFLSGQFERYIGIDILQHKSGFPGVFVQANLDVQPIPLPSNSANVVTAVEVIEHLENPRAFMRELVRIVKPNGWVIVTTPNQASLLSKFTFILKNQFNEFQDSSYPAHITALLESDLLRLNKECFLGKVGTYYSLRGRVPFTASQFPKFLSRLFPRAFSDNILVIGCKVSDY
ncbi:MAG: class I SAM-dependent methyltransferase [Deltaproteobacteria bacterium]|nr:class I SAM-dependent methyltransferase [Deltaproteobacteria bacterium]